MRSAAAVLVTFAAAIGCSAATTHDTVTPSNHASKPSGSVAAVTYADWPTYHGSITRAGVSTTMPAATAATKLSRSISLDGAVYASPIVAGGLTFVATENDTVYAFTTANAQVWKTHLGTPSPASERPCGDIDPLGITGTPVYYNGTVYVVAEEHTSSGPIHQLIALRATTGAVLWRRSVDLPGVTTAAMQERGALAAAGGKVWVPFGGLAGDCSNYKGRIVAVNLDGSGTALSYTVPTTREAGMWTPPGATGYAYHLYFAVGNGAAGPGSPYDHSDSILKFDELVHLVDFFAPSTWASDNASDADLGSQGPAVVGGKWVYADGKSGTAYVLALKQLGGIGGEVSQASICRSFGGTAVVGSTVYVPCTDGLRAVSIDSTGHLHVIWHAASNIVGSPVVGGGKIWSLDPSGGVLYALNPSNGSISVHVSVGQANRFATPALSGNRVLVGTLAGLAVVTTT